MTYKPSSELEDLIEQLLGEEKPKFFQSIAESLPHTIRFNSLKGETDLLKSFLFEQGIRVELFPGFNDIYRVISQPYPIGKSLSHFLGHFYVQDIASMLPVRVLSPEPGELVLDMSAAPGSKTTQIADMMQNQGLIFANDIVPKRLRALINNLQRMGIINTAVIRSYAESIGNQYFETFDKVLLDPACSGLGTLHKSPEILSWWTPKHCTRMAANQKSMLLSAIKALKPGGILVYSTCTLSPEENEEVIDQAVQQLPVRILDIELPELLTRPGLTDFANKRFNKQLARCRRIYPFENQTEGFFLAKLQKTAGMEDKKQKTWQPFQLNFISDKTSPVKKYLDYFSQHFGIPREVFSEMKYHIKNDITVVSPEIADFTFYSKPFKTGLTMARPMTHIGKMTTEGIHLFGKYIQANKLKLNDLNTLESFVNRESLNLASSGTLQTALFYQDFPVGYGLTENGKFKSQFPKAEWPFQVVVTS